MSVQVENLEKNMAKLTIEIPAEDLEKAIQAVYLKQKSRINIPGFRKGKVPRAIIEQMYGPGIFFEEAANTLISQNYPKAVDEAGIEIVSRPEIDITQMEKGKPFIFTAEVAVKPEVVLGEYFGMQITKADLTVSEEEVDAVINRERKSNARRVTVDNRPAQDGDIVVIDYEGFVDGVAFEGGKGENHSLSIGSHTFVDTFEEQLIGKNTGEEVEVNVTFPEDYHASDLAGVPAMFKVKIHEIKANEMPELDDEFAQDVSEFDTFEEYKENVKKNIAQKKEEESKRAQGNEAIQKVINNSQMEIPDAMVNSQIDTMVDEFANRIGQQGLSVEQYMKFTSTTEEQLRDQMRPEAIWRIESSLVLEEVAKKEDIQVSEEDVNAEIDHIAEIYAMDSEKFKEMLSDSQKVNMKRDIAIQRAADLIYEHAVETEAASE